jgi:hypothetical protein
MVSTNPIYRNRVSPQERFKMLNSGMDINAVRDITGRASDFRTPTRPANPLDQFGDLQRRNADAYGASIMAGGSGAEQLARNTQLQPLAFAEDNTTFVDGQATPRGLGQGMPMPSGNPSGFRARMAPRDEAPAWDPFDNPNMNNMTGMEKRRAREARGFAEGGPVIGPGGPKDDQVNAKLSHGEYVMPAEVVQFFGMDRLNKMVQKAKEGAAETPMPEMKPDPMGQMMPAFAMGGPMMKPHYAEGGFNDMDTINRIGQAAAAARMREQDAMLSPVGYSPTLNDSPAFQPLPVSSSPSPQVPFQPDPDALLEMRTRRFMARSAAPGTANGTQPPMQLASPMPEPVMRPAPLTMTEKERMLMPMAPNRTPMASPEFEAALTGLTGMEKRRARAGLAMEAATFGRNQGRADVALRADDQRAELNRARDFEDWQRKQVIGDQFQQAAEKRRLAADASMTEAQRREQTARTAAEKAEQQRLAKDFTPIEGTNYLINGLGNLVSKATGKPAGLAPDEAAQFGLEIIGADSEGRVRYAPAKAKPPVQRFYDPTSSRIIELQPDELPPPDSGWKPIQRQAQAPAQATPATKADVESLRKKYGY